ncbi:Uncharacterised protein [Klebsiella pneumoniae subsp. ozaenae]|uniref:Uncharacterized protein n=1 Tax=Klebsiella pneumoniae subsp. ozaenae TaxID=574 RepID=A0A378B0F2_KLEPO|nr:Uncharacterised protein [Klebsiella pneumoniae subsp. ozaenae]
MPATVIRPLLICDASVVPAASVPGQPATPTARVAPSGRNKIQMGTQCCQRGLGAERADDDVVACSHDVRQRRCDIRVSGPAGHSNDGSRRTGCSGLRTQADIVAGRTFVLRGQGQDTSRHCGSNGQLRLIIDRSFHLCSDFSCGICALTATSTRVLPIHRLTTPCELAGPVMVSVPAAATPALASLTPITVRSR